MAVRTRNKFTYIDLFAGCGGLSLGLHNAGWKALFAIEKSEDAFKTLKFNLMEKKQHFNWPSWLDIKNYNINDLLEEKENRLKELQGQIDLVAGGPPCQGFSTAGKREEHDERNVLVNSYLEFVELVKPRVLLFENVRAFGVGFKNQFSKRGKPYSEVVIEKLQAMGYKDATSHVIDFSRFGVPQMRRRFIIIATLKGNSQDFFKSLEEKRKAFLAEKGIKAGTTIAEAISDIERKNGVVKSPDSKNFKAGKYNGCILTPYQELMRRENNSTIPDSHRFVNHNKNTVKKFRDIIANDLSNEEIQKKYKTRKTSTSLLKPGRLCLTLTTLPDDYVHYSEPRVLTVREYARIQSFPDWFQFKGVYTTGTKRRRHTAPRYSQVANAIPPLFSELCGMAIKELLNE
jgi:DNA (cytosine-5)-methyltransferase 1